MNEQERISGIYAAVFNNHNGKRVLADLKRIALATRINKDAPSLEAALYAMAQIALIQRIENLSGLKHTNYEDPTNEG
jgi:hypothetical protein